MSGRALLLVGSPGNLRSNSDKIGQYLLDRLTDAGWATDKECIYQVVKDIDLTKKAFDKMDSADLIVLSFPLYVDSLPSQTIRFMELASGRGADMKKGQRFMAVCQSGFPESRHSELALRICSIFARDVGYQWVGGLAVGGGAAIEGRELKEAGGMLRNLRSALDMTARAMEQGMDVPAKARELTNKGIAPPWIFNWIVNRKWKTEARRNGVDLFAKLVILTTDPGRDEEMVKAKPASERKVRKRAELEDRILKAAEQLILAKGYANTTIDEIAAKSDVSKGAVYLHYRTKDDIYFSILSSALQTMRDMFQEASEGQEIGLAKFRAIGYSFYEYTKKYPSYTNIIYDVNSPKLSHSLPSEAKCQTLNEEIRRILVVSIESGMKDGSIRSDVDAMAAAIIISSSLQGLLKTVLSNREFVGAFGLDENYLVNFSLDLYGRSLMSLDRSCHDLTDKPCSRQARANISK